jgi:hypothetical protein
MRVVIALLAGVVFLFSTSGSFPDYTPRSANSPYKLPVPQGVYVTVTQGNNMPHTKDWDHWSNTDSAYAFDFALLTSPSPFVVTAAADGTVMYVQTGSDINCDGLDHQAGEDAKVKYPDCWTHANYVLIANADGKTAQLYMHFLKDSIKVREKYPVKQGQQLGLAGTTGFALGNPHLHFQVEDMPQIPSPDDQKKNLGWWFTQSRAIAFSNPEVSKIRSDGVPLTGDPFCLGNTTCSSAPPPVILPGGKWFDPSPKDGQVVQDTIHFAAHAYPTHAGDPAIAQVNFTVGAQGGWKVACTAIPPKNGDVFACDANLKDLGVPYGQVQVSFDVYDQAGNVNLAPNGVHTLTYAPPVPELTYIGSDGNVWDMTLPSGTPKQLTNDAQPNGGVRYSGLAWAPDGRKFAVVRDSASSNQRQITLHILSPEGVVLLDAPLQFYPEGRPFAWSPDSRLIAYRELLGGAGDNETIYVFDTQAKAVKQTFTLPLLSYGCSGFAGPLSVIIEEFHYAPNIIGIDTFIWAPNQQNMLVDYPCSTSMSEQLDVNTGNLIQGFPGGASYQANGNAILGDWFSTDYSTIFMGLTDATGKKILTLASERESALDQTVAVTLGQAVWSSNSQSIYYEHDDGIWQIGADGSNAHVIIPGTPFDSQGNATVNVVPRPSPDGTMLLYAQIRGTDNPDATTATGQWYTAQADGTKVTPLPQAGFQINYRSSGGVFEMVWRPGT